jgi:hypothetical protein
MFFDFLSFPELDGGFVQDLIEPFEIHDSSLWERAREYDD